MGGRRHCGKPGDLEHALYRRSPLQRRRRGAGVLAGHGRASQSVGSAVTISLCAAHLSTSRLFGTIDSPLDES